MKKRILVLILSSISNAYTSDSGYFGPDVPDASIAAPQTVHEQIARCTDQGSEYALIDKWEEQETLFKQADFLAAFATKQPRFTLASYIARRVTSDTEFAAQCWNDTVKTPDGRTAYFKGHFLAEVNRSLARQPFALTGEQLAELGGSLKQSSLKEKQKVALAKLMTQGVPS